MPSNGSPTLLVFEVIVVRSLTCRTVPGGMMTGSSAALALAIEMAAVRIMATRVKLIRFIAGFILRPCQQAVRHSAAAWSTRGPAETTPSPFRADTPSPGFPYSTLSFDSKYPLLVVQGSMVTVLGFLLVLVGVPLATPSDRQGLRILTPDTGFQLRGCIIAGGAAKIGSREWASAWRFSISFGTA